MCQINTDPMKSQMGFLEVVGELCVVVPLRHPILIPFSSVFAKYV